MTLANWVIVAINLVIALGVGGAGILMLRRALAKQNVHENWVGLAVGGVLIALLGTIGVLIVILFVVGIAT